MNEPIAAVIVGLLLSLSAGVRVTLPLLAVNLLAFFHEITLPATFDWLGTEPSLIILSVAFTAETIIHFLPAAGTGLKAVATPLAFVAGTLLMAVPLSGHNPLYQWGIAAVLGGGTATLAHLGVTGVRAMTEPANVASFGLVGIAWNLGEFFVSTLLAVLSGLSLSIGWAIGAVALVVIVILAVLSMIATVGQWSRFRSNLG